MSIAKKQPNVPKGMRLYKNKCVPAEWKDWQAALVLFGNSKGEEKLQNWKDFIEHCWPEPAFIWDDWATLFFGALCGAKKTVEELTGESLEIEGENWFQESISTGCASSGKSSKAALWILGNWLCAQEHTTCILTSTSLDQLKRRIWAELCDWIAKSKIRFPLEIIASDTEIRWHKNDKRSAIFGIAVKSGGSVVEATDRLKGVHNRCVFVVIDEMTSVPPAIVFACNNLNKGTKRFQMIGLGNALPGENPHTIHAEPKHGWNSVSVDRQIWLTKKGGICLHFDGHRSPALKDPDRFHFYIKQSELDRDREAYGGENTPEYWTNDRGFWPPSGLSNCVMDMALLNQFNVSDKATWKTGWEVGGAFDPAFEGGDRRVLYPFRWGAFMSGVAGIEYLPPIIVGVDMSQDVRWIHYQIADAVQALCEGYEIEGRKVPILPRNFIMDTTGEGGGLFSVMSGRWSAEIQSVEFGGAAEKEVMFPDRPTTYYETYANKVTMLWYVLRRFIEGDQVRGLSDAETRNELTTREKKMRGGKTAIQPKSEMKGMKHRSPDKADATVIASEFLRRKGIVPAGSSGGAALVDPVVWNAWAEKTDPSSEYDYEDATAAFAL